ncbi:hypothetical protein Tco_1390501, partial [Tanacetum coccineum]
ASIAEYEINRANAAGARPTGSARARGVGAAGVEGAGPAGAGGAGPVGGNTRGNVEPEVLGYMITVEYCPRNEIQKLKQELWNLIVKGDDIARYTDHFHELAVMCPIMVTHDYKNIMRYIWGLPERILGNVTSFKPASTHEAIRMTHSLMDQVIRAQAARINDSNKRKWEDQQRGNNNNTHYYHQNRRQEAARAYAATLAKGRGYAGSLPFYNRCKLHHTDQCTIKCMNYQRVCHQAKHRRSKTPATNTRQPTTIIEL